MSEPQLDGAGDEKVIAAFHTSYRNYFAHINKLLLILLTAFLALPFLMLIDKYTNITITNQRIKFAKGLLSRVHDEIELYRVKDLRYEDTLIQRMLGIGDIVIRSSEATAPVVRIKDVRGASELRDQLRTLVEARRAQRGVREIDVT